MILNKQSIKGGVDDSFSYPVDCDLKRSLDRFEAPIGFQSEAANVEEGGRSERVIRELVTGEYFGQLHIRIARLERRLKFIHANFPQEALLPVENTTIDSRNNRETEKSIVVKDACPETIAFYRRYHPKSPIIISPPEDVPKGSLF